MRRLSLRAVGLLLLLLTVGCESSLPSLYNVPVRQGNYLDQTLIGQLHPGMTKSQVQRVAGTALIMDPFHQDRWDYYYHYKQGNDISERHHLTLFFKGDTLDRMEDAFN